MYYTVPMPITTALITAAGFGTRFLPITKTIQKEMLPLLDRPIVDYVVDDLLKAGVTKIVFVISEHNKQLIHYFRENKRLEAYLTSKGKQAEYTELAHLHAKAEFHFIKQPDTDPYGTATPLLLAQPMLKDEPAFFVVTGDDCIYFPDGRSASTEMAAEFARMGAAGAVTCIAKPRAELGAYGVVSYQATQQGRLLQAIVEKPAPAAAPSNLANISKYIFTPAVFEIVKNQSVNTQSGELYITDTLTSLAQIAPVAIYETSGVYLDAGNPLEWLKSNTMVGLDHPTWGARYRTFLTSLLN